jgi:polar amino acid transport system substrate-binding protein
VTMRALPLVIMLLLTASVSARADDIRLAAGEYPPYTSADLPDGGLLGELTHRAFAVSGHQVQIDFLPWARAVLLMRRGQYDGLMAIWPDKAKAEKLVVSRPLVSSDLGFFVRKNTPTSFTTLSQLKDRTVGTVRGYNYPRSILNSGIVAEDAADNLSNLRKLAAQRFDYVLLEKQVGLYLLDHDPDLQKKLVWQDPVLQRLPLFVGFAAPKAGQPDWPALYEQGLKQLVESGEYLRVLKKYDVTMP